ncbi:MAG: hypothetical protein JSR77_07305 [Planctomycetes bacterium]|nr:hypothetical protein [Planctomycetota bacterium]
MSTLHPSTPANFWLRWLAMFAATVNGACVLAQDLVLRKGYEGESGPVNGVSAEGVDIPGTGKGHKTIPWDAVAGLGGPWQEQAAPYLAVAETAWRARIRLERGDLAGAEPLFEQLFPDHCKGQGPLSQLVSGGLLICRLGRGAQMNSVAPCMAYLHAIEQGSVRTITRGGDVADPSDRILVDSATNLVPLLPPVWLSGPGVAALAHGNWAPYEGRTGLISNLYQQSARAEAGLAVALPTRPRSDDGAELVWDVVVSRVGDAAQRAAARESLRSRSDKGQAPWMESWCRVAIGRSLLRESDTESQNQGIAELAVLPAALERVCPYLTGIALAEMAMASLRLSDAKTAITLRSRLAEKFPGHPALDWEPLRQWSAAAAPDPIVPSDSLGSSPAADSEGTRRK